jgi:hypothetical protein
MKRSMKYVKEILSIIEKGEIEVQFGAENFIVVPFNNENFNWNREELMYHLTLLGEEGFLRSIESFKAHAVVDDTNQGYGVKGLTWKGHDLLDELYKL